MNCTQTIITDLSADVVDGLRFVCCSIRGRQGNIRDSNAARSPNLHLTQGQAVSRGKLVMDDLTGQGVLGG